MSSTDFLASHANVVREIYPAATQADAEAAGTVISGSLVFGIDITNFHTVAITVSGVPIEDPTSRYSNPTRIGVNVPASGTVSVEGPFVATDGLKFYSTSTGGTNSVVHVRSNQ